VRTLMLTHSDTHYNWPPAARLARKRWELTYFGHTYHSGNATILRLTNVWGDRQPYSLAIDRGRAKAQSITLT